jgi:PEP-CTERM motif
VFSTTPTTAILTTSSGTLITINQNTGVATVDNSDSIDHWGAGLFGSGIALASVNQQGENVAPGGKPDDLIIGPGPYSVNSSVTQHQPEIQDTGTFDLTLSGITSATTVKSVTFLFGTGSDDGPPLNGTSVTIPEPDTLVLMGSALLAVGILRRRLL